MALQTEVPRLAIVKIAERGAHLLSNAPWETNPGSP